MDVGAKSIRKETREELLLLQICQHFSHFAWFLFYFEENEDSKIEEERKERRKAPLIIFYCRYNSL